MLALVTHAARKKGGAPHKQAAALEQLLSTAASLYCTGKSFEIKRKYSEKLASRVLVRNYALVFSSVA